MRHANTEIDRVVRAKMDYNSNIILENLNIIEESIKTLRTATKEMSMDQMNVSLRAIVDSAIGCRSRLQFMRGCWAMYKDLKPTYQPEEAA